MSISFGESSEYDIFVDGVPSRDLYLENCARILSDTLG